MLGEIVQILVATGLTECFVDYGDGVRVLELSDSTEKSYQIYCEAFAKAGFEKKIENYPEIYGNAVYTSSYIKGEEMVTITHITKRGKTYISVKEQGALSEHLFYKESYIEGNLTGAKTKLHMPELHTYGGSFIIQLKNGHFILEDGGMPGDDLYLVDFLESLVPKGEKPVVEAWFITHGHGDHIGALGHFEAVPENGERLCVEGVYFSVPSEKVQKLLSVPHETKYGLEGIEYLRTSEGKVPPLYRPQTGQRYYFNDITVDILHTQEQHLIENYDNGFNDSSTWYLYTIEGQTFLSAGDAGDGSVKVVKETYEQKYLDFDVMATFHHAQNVTKTWVKYFNYTTVLYTTFSNGPQTWNYHEKENVIMRERAQEYMCWGDGRKVLTFPYKVGECECIPPRDWPYEPDRKLQKPYGI